MFQAADCSGFAETSLRNKAVADNENNLIRSTLELASAMIGGADAVFPIIIL
ncbi:methylmalonyl-CoA mutase family protein [Chryseobacterium sp. CH1]|uniref:methylmalonyl-CoA mutase family protein n=1 Tax=Chryseobacterium sp. CH1 TaxID=713551 RepID=UPI001E3E5653|nr:methylmalonyl-CoA mutase family protein [Chryseobacterium sp. CH1]